MPRETRTEIPRSSAKDLQNEIDFKELATN